MASAASLARFAAAAGGKYWMKNRCFCGRSVSRASSALSVPAVIVSPKCQHIRRVVCISLVRALPNARWKPKANPEEQYTSARWRLSRPDTCAQSPCLQIRLPSEKNHKYGNKERQWVSEGQRQDVRRPPDSGGGPSILIEVGAACASFTKAEAATEAASRPRTERRLWAEISPSSLCCARTATTPGFPEAPTLLPLLLLLLGTRVLDEITKAPSKTTWEAPRRPAIDATAFAISPTTSKLPNATDSELQKTEGRSSRDANTDHTQAAKVLSVCWDERETLREDEESNFPFTGSPFPWERNFIQTSRI
jgi:hypothetical protein